MTDFPWGDEDRFGSAKRKAISEDAILETLERDIARGIQPEGARGNRSVNPPANFDDVKVEYATLFREAEILPEHLGGATTKFSVLRFADQIRQNRSRYDEITAEAQVPWVVIGILHVLECSFGFERHLFNGDPLTDFTRRFPPGEPNGLGGPPFTFNESAIAALKHEGFHNQADWSLARTLHRFERYNGMSYRTRLTMASPYLWSFTSLYDKGKFKEIPKPGGGPTLGTLFSKHPNLADQVRDIIAKGRAPGVVAGSLEQQELEAFVAKRPPRRALESREAPATESVRRRTRAFEAIVRMIGRPSLLVQSRTYVIPEEATEAVPAETLTYMREQLRRPIIDPIIARTGRVDLIDIPTIPFLGTAWVIDKPRDRLAVLATNRYVASEFARADGRGGFQFLTAPNFRDYEAEVDFLHEYNNEERANIKRTRVRHIAAPSDPDMALIEIEGDGVAALQPIEIDTARPRQDQETGVVDYPAYDSRNDDAAIARYFGDIFNVKRFAFGEVAGVSERRLELTHDATTLGGNSGSCVFDLATGKAVGLHFAGDFSRGNFGVTSEAISKALVGLKTTAIVSRPESEEAVSDGVKPVPFYRGRDGYQRDFLGGGAKRVELPGFGHWADDLAEIDDADRPTKTNELRYRHFSVIVSESRKLPLLTAVNINGSTWKRLGRVDKWYVDGRLKEDFQVGNEAYSHKPLDRGYTVRREDPVWGSIEEAEQANIDTFHYTNAAPQNEGLNQKEWLSLEDYVLGNARTHNLMVTVFTGPIFRDNDPLYRDVVRLSRDFWKVAVIVDADTNKLSATGYVLTQGELLRQLTEAFVCGAFRTYQVPISLIGEQSGLDFSKLEPDDPFARPRANEGLEGTAGIFNPISSSADLVLGRETTGGVR